MTKETKPRYSAGGWMIIPGWRKSGFNPRPSPSEYSTAPAGWNIAWTTFPLGVAHKRLKGFSKKMIRIKKKPNVIRETTTTQGRNSRSRFHFRKVTALANADISQAQKTREPDCPP